MIIPVLTSVTNAKDGSSLTIKDSTGAYNVSTNPGGYGTPNADEPTVVGFRVRYWADTDIYGSLVTDDTTILAALLGAGFALTIEQLGESEADFSSGVHHIKYYPLEEVDTIVTLTKDSKLVTVTAGTAPSTWDSDYVGIVFNDGATLGTKVFLIDRNEAITSTTFYLTEAWTDDTITGQAVMLAPEADLKILAVEEAQSCLVGRIGKLGKSCTCNEDEVDLLMWLTMQIFAAQINFDCADYTNAHNKIVNVHLQADNCKTTCSCN